MTYVTLIWRVPGSRAARGRTRAKAKPCSETTSVRRSTVRSMADWSKVLPGIVSSSLRNACGSTPASADSMSILPKVIGLTLVEDVSDVEARPVARQLGARGHDAHVGVAVLQVVLAQQLPIQGQPVGIVDVGALDEVEQSRLRGGDDVAQLGIGEGPVADDIDGLNLGRAALVDLEHDIHAIVVELDDLGLDGGGKPALAAVDVEDALHVRLRLGTREDRARLELHLVDQRRLVDLPVALESHLVDDRVLDHRDDHGAPSRSMRTSANRPVENSDWID